MLNLFNTNVNYLGDQKIGPIVSCPQPEEFYCEGDQGSWHQPGITGYNPDAISRCRKKRWWNGILPTG